MNQSKKMKLLVHPLLLLLLLASCEEPKTVNREDLVGKWEAESLNGGPLAIQGMKSNILEFKDNDSLEVTTLMTSFGMITLTLKGTWKLEDGALITKISDSGRVCQIQLNANELLVSPDPVFSPERIMSSRYKKLIE